MIPATGEIPQFRGNVIANLQERLEDRFVDAQTIRPDWHGETMDTNLAVSHLWDIKQPLAFTRRARRPLKPAVSTLT